MLFLLLIHKIKLPPVPGSTIRTGRFFFFFEAGRDGVVVFFQRRDRAVVFFVRAGTGVFFLAP